MTNARSSSEPIDVVSDRYVTISVDDGSAGDMKTADLLHKYGLQATFYIPGRNPERPVIGPSQIRELSRRFEIGSHTLNHAPLKFLSDEKASQEIREGKQLMEEVLGEAVISFCYPRGKFNGTTPILVKNAGFLGARTSLMNLHDFPRNPFLWGVSTQAYSHSKMIHVRHALLEGNFAGIRNFFQDYKGATDWEEHFSRALAHVAGWIKPVLGIVVSPLLGMVLGLLLSVSLSWSLWRQDGRFMQWLFRKLQLGSAALYSISHGSNDAQKTMGIIVGLLVSSQALFAQQRGILHRFFLANADGIPVWIVIMCYAAIATGTAMGGWRIVRTMGMRITRLRPFDGFCAETGGAMTILFASSLGVPVSTTHTITGAIVGVGASKRLGAVRWGIARRIVWAWVMTIPAAAIIAAVVFWVLPK